MHLETFACFNMGYACTMIVLTRTDQLLIQLLVDQFDYLH